MNYFVIMADLPSIGFIGLGIMGMPMARHIAEAGYPVTVFNRTRSKADAAQAFGARVAQTPREAATGVRVLITMVTDPGALQDLMEGREGFLASPTSEVTWVQTSTLDIESTLQLAKRAKAKGWHFIDCPVVGSKKQVEETQLILLAGGDEELIRSLKPLLYRIGSRIVHTGPVGSGTALKLCMNLIVAQMTTALAESITLANATGVDPSKIFEVIRNSPALDCGYFRIKQEALLKKDFSPAFSLANMLKDVRFMAQEAAKRGLELPVTDAVRRLMERSAQEGHAPKDLSAIYLTLSNASAGTGPKGR
jgi:3-hydroxyisobutyrate dehydrogenase-like beta-hydroxyacid dehydrogenase